MIVLEGELPNLSDPIVIEVVMAGGDVVSVGVTPCSIRIGLDEVELLTASMAADSVPVLSSPAELVTGV